MGILRWYVLAVCVAACGSVKALPDGSHGGDDAPTCTGCISDGETCTADTQCSSSACVCNNASCGKKICAASACACGFTSTGVACDGELAAGTPDASCASGCDGTGECATPLLWFKFDEPSGTAIVNSGTWPGSYIKATGTQGVAGVNGKAIQFTAATDGIAIADPSDNSLDAFSAWTAEAWVNFSAIGANTNITIVKKDGGYICRGVATTSYFHQGIIFTPSGQQPASYSMAIPPLNTWFHAACVFSNGTLKLYWNGALVGTAGVNGAESNTASNLGIGQSSADTENLLGMMDDFKMWSTARTDRQICLDACGSFSGTTCTFDGVCGN